MNKIVQLPGYLAATPAFRWGERDCCTFAANWLVLLGEPDPMADLRGYKTAKEALRLYRTGLLPKVLERLGEPMEHPLCAQRGDIAVVEMDNGREACGIVVGEAVAVPGQSGVAYLPLMSIVAAWRV